MTSTRAAVDKEEVSRTSVMLGHDKGPHITTYHCSYVLNMPETLTPSRHRYQLPPSEIFHRTEETFPLTVHQASFGSAPKSVMKKIHNERKQNFQRIKSTHRKESVPMGGNTESYYSGLEYNSQMKSDYIDRHFSLKRNWSKLQQPKLPRLPCAEVAKNSNKQPHRIWHGYSTEAAHSYRWPLQSDKLMMRRVTFTRNS